MGGPLHRPACSGCTQRWAAAAGTSSAQAGSPTLAEWVEYRPNQVWGFDVTHFPRCRRAPNCFAIVDLVSRKWITTLVSPEETATHTKVLFLAGLEAEGLIDRVEERLITGELPDPDALPILLAVSDNGAPMTADTTKAFMALCSIAQHFGRPGVPTDQAPIESFWGHVKADWPHLEAITDARCSAPSWSG